MPFARCLLLFSLLFITPAWAADDAGDSNDPWEPMNRKVFAFNEGLDKYLLRPMARGYRFIAPEPVERGVSNFVLNIYEFNTAINSLLQWRPEDAFDSSGRFIINTTFGLLGFFDVASSMGIPRKPADFGQTLAVWGADQGPFLMVPVVGPRTVRSGVGILVDGYISVPALFGDSGDTLAFFALDTLEFRAQLIKGDQLITGDRYIFLREVYLQRREYLISNGKVEDSFSDFETEAEFEDF